MGSLINKIRKGYAAYWARTGNAENGQPTYAAPIEIRVRWEDVVEEYLDRDGRKKISRARVFVDRDMPYGSAIREGKLATVAHTTEPFKNTDTWEIQQVAKLPNRRYKKFLRWVML